MRVGGVLLLLLLCCAAPVQAEEYREDSALCPPGSSCGVAAQTELVRRRVEDWAERTGGIELRAVRLRQARPFSLPQGAGPLACALDEGSLSRGRGLADLNFPDRLGRLRHRWVQVELEAVRQVLRLRRTVERQQPIRPEDLEEVAVELKGGPGPAAEVLSDPRQALERVARRRLPAGTLLAPADLEAPLLVRRGDEVQATAVKGGLRLTAQAQALERGALGDWITLKVSNSNKIIRGIVTARRKVDVPF